MPPAPGNVTIWKLRDERTDPPRDEVDRMRGQLGACLRAHVDALAPALREPDHPDADDALRMLVRKSPELFGQLAGLHAAAEAQLDAVQKLGRKISAVRLAKLKDIHQLL